MWCVWLFSFDSPTLQTLLVERLGTWREVGGASLELKYIFELWNMECEHPHRGILYFWDFGLHGIKRSIITGFFNRYCHLGSVSLPLVSRVRAPYSEGREDGNLELQNTRSINIDSLHFSGPWMLSFSILPETFSAVSGHGAGWNKRVLISLSLTTLVVVGV